jgi:hypothetical protein
MKKSGPTQMKYMKTQDLVIPMTQLTMATALVEEKVIHTEVWTGL